MIDKVMTLRNRISNEDNHAKAKDLFQGAGLIITTPEDSYVNKAYIVVKTRLAYELSAIVFSLKEIFMPVLDYLNKYEFYGRLGDSANQYLNEHQDNEGILLAVIDEAIEMSKEWKS